MCSIYKFCFGEPGLLVQDGPASQSRHAQCQFDVVILVIKGSLNTTLNVMNVDIGLAVQKKEKAICVLSIMSLVILLLLKDREC